MCIFNIIKFYPFPINSIKKELKNLIKIILLDPMEEYEDDEIYLGDLKKRVKNILKTIVKSFLKKSIQPAPMILSIFVKLRERQPIRKGSF